MPVFKRPGAETYSYDFRLRGARYSGNSGCTQKREAEKFEAAERKRAKAQLTEAGQPMRMAAAAVRYWDEVGQHHVNSDTTLRTLAWLEHEFGKNKLISEIRSADIARAVVKRRAPDADGRTAAAATVNRSVVQPMRAVLTRAADTWGQTVAKIDWSSHMLKEPQERVRELHDDEETALFATLRVDYHAIVRFALWTGCRLQECLDLEWRHIDWRNLSMRVTGKGDKTRTIPLTTDVHALLKFLPRADDRVFTYIARRPRRAGATIVARGQRAPIEREGIKSIFERAVKKAGIEDFTFHDLRHTCATRLLRTSGNLRLVKDLLGHEDIATTMKYAHVTTDDLRNAMNRTARDHAKPPVVENATKNATNSDR